MKFETKLAKDQKAAKLAYKNRGTVLWASCIVVSTFPIIKEAIQGTCRIRKNQQQLRGKAAIKAQKRSSHTKGFYAADRNPPF